MKSRQPRYFRIRILLVGAAFSICLMVIGARAIYIQVFQGAWLSSLAADQYEKSFTARGMRGTIYDTRHREMAVSLEGASIAAYPPRITDVTATARTVGDILDIQPAVVKAKLTTDRRFVWLKRQASPRETEAVKALNLIGIDFRTEPVRLYPHRTLAAQVLGFSGVDGRGLDGLEFYYDAFLKGDPDRFRVLKDAHGRGFAADKNSLPDNRGNNIILTIDQTIQFICENVLAETVASSSAASAMAVVMAPGSGAVLALAHFPRFNPNRFRDYDNRIRRNRAITDAFEPGSILKIFTAAAALESGLCSPNTIFFCENGEYPIGGRTIHDTHPQAWLSLQQIIKHSSNIGMAKVGEMIGPQRLYDTMAAFGFGSKTGIDSPGETSGSMRPYRRWKKIDAATVTFGQGISASALQLTAALSAVANDGVLMKPRIVQAISDADGRLLRIFKPVKIRQAVSARSARAVGAMMTTVVNAGGTGTQAALEGFRVAGKTGTAQKVGPDGTYAEDAYVASFMGFAPFESPVVAILVVVDEPRGKYYGGQVAAPAFKKIAQQTLQYLNLSPAQQIEKLTASRRREVRG